MTKRYALHVCTHNASKLIRVTQQRCPFTAFQKLNIEGKEWNYLDEAMLSVRASLYIATYARFILSVNLTTAEVIHSTWIIKGKKIYRR